MHKKTIHKLIILLALIILVPGCDAMPKESRNYLDILRVFWKNLYPNGGATLYCDQKFAPFDRKVNVEHVYPMSWVTKKLHCGKRDQCRRTSDRFNFIESDMHNLYPARKDVNQKRSAYPFTILKGEKHVFRGCDFEVDYKSRKVEPAPEARGRIARAMLYMADEHDLDIFSSQRKMLKKWHKQYPATDAERRRNLLIQQVQGNANPYIR